MSTSILNDIKHQLGFLPEDTAFDGVIVAYINGAFGTLNQLGVGLSVGFQITGPDETWAQFYTDPRLNSIPAFIFLTVKLLFDPPQTSFEIGAMERQIKEMEFRLNVVADYG